MTVADTAAPAVEVQQLRVILGEQFALRGVSLKIRAGSRVALVGANGAGKSTLLRALAGLVRPESGEIAIHGTRLAVDPWRARRAIGFVAHQPMLYPELTANENLSFYARLYGLDQIPERVAGGLARVGLSDRSKSRVGTLSRGMLQRLALARALIHEPSILLLDEAESGLDAVATGLLLDVLQAETGLRTVILASHDLGFVRAAADEVIMLRAGRIAVTGQLAGQPLTWLQQRYAEVLATPTASSVARPGPVCAEGARRL